MGDPESRYRLDAVDVVLNSEKGKTRQALLDPLVRVYRCETAAVDSVGSGILGEWKSRFGNS